MLEGIARCWFVEFISLFKAVLLFSLGYWAHRSSSWKAWSFYVDPLIFCCREGIVTGLVVLLSVRTECRVHCCYSDPLLSSSLPPTAIFQHRTCDHVYLSCFVCLWSLRCVQLCLEGRERGGERGRGDTLHPWMEPVSGSLTDGSGLVWRKTLHSSQMGRTNNSPPGLRLVQWLFTIFRVLLYQLRVILSKWC